MIRLDQVRTRLTSLLNPTGDDRAGRRWRLAGRAALSALVGKGAGLVTIVISVALAPDYLGLERYGMWMTITAAALLLSFADFGMSNSLVNAVSEADGEGDEAALKRAVSGGFYLLAGVAATLLALFFAAFPFVDWPGLFNVDSPLARSEAGISAALGVTLFLLTIPLGVVQRVQIGLQETWRVYLWQAAGSAFAIVGLVLVIRLDWGLPWLVVAVSGGPVLAATLNWISFFALRAPHLAPEWGLIDWREMGALARVSGYFLGMQILFIASGAATDNLIIAQVLGASAVAAFAVAQRLAHLLQVIEMVSYPLWPAFSEAMARGDTLWARRALLLLLATALAAGVFAGTFFLWAGAWIITLWAGPQMVPSDGVMAGIAVLIGVNALAHSVSALLNTARFIRHQFVVYGIGVAMAVALKIALTSAWDDPAGAVWGTVIGVGMVYLVPALVLAFSGLRAKASRKTRA